VILEREAELAQHHPLKKTSPLVPLVPPHAIYIMVELRGGGGHFCGRVARLASSEGLLDVPAQTLLIPTIQTWLSCAPPTASPPQGAHHERRSRPAPLGF
jgi:hypothetical protein